MADGSSATIFLSLSTNACLPSVSFTSSITAKFPFIFFFIKGSSSLPSASSIHFPVSLSAGALAPGTTSACSLNSLVFFSFQPMAREYFLRLSIEATANEPSSSAGLAMRAVSKFPSSGFTP